MLVKELIALLSRVDPEAKVRIDGCDCAAPPSAGYIVDGGITITREDVEYLYAKDQRVGIEVSA